MEKYRDNQEINQRSNCNYHKSNYSVNENLPVNSGKNHAIEKDKTILVRDSMLNNKNSCGLAKLQST